MDMIMAEAQEMYQDDFMEWHKQFQEIECEFATMPVLPNTTIFVKDFDLQNIVDLIYQPLDSEIIQATLSQFGCPSTAGKEKRNEFEISFDEIGLYFEFERIGSVYNTDNKLILRLIIIDNNCSYPLPFGLNFTDSLIQIERKIGKSAEYKLPYEEELRIWKLQNIAGKNYGFYIVFEDSQNFIGIESLSIVDFFPENEANMEENRL